MLWMKIKRAARNPWLYACSAIILFFMLRTVWRYIVEPGISSIDALSFIINPTGFSMISPYAAFFCVVPYSATFCDEYRCGFARTLLPRAGRPRYALGNILSVALSGSLVFMLPLAITCLVAVLKAAPTTGANLSDYYSDTIWEPIFFQHGTGAVMGLKIAVSGLFGMVWSQLGLFVSCLSLNRFVTIIVPFVLYQTMWSVFDATLLSPVIYLWANASFFPSLGYVVGVQLGLFAVLSALSYAAICWRCRNV
ncbi:hypothetical protein ACH6CV_05810 [Bacillota bacterium Meth-B3]